MGVDNSLFTCSLRTDIGGFTLISCWFVEINGYKAWLISEKAFTLFRIQEIERSRIRVNYFHTFVALPRGMTIITERPSTFFMNEVLVLRITISLLLSQRYNS